MELRESEVYRPLTKARDSHRRIVNIFQGLVFYSNGGELIRHCKIESFLRWVRSHNGELLT